MLVDTEVCINCPTSKLVQANRNWKDVHVLLFSVHKLRVDASAASWRHYYTLCWLDAEPIGVIVHRYIPDRVVYCSFNIDGWCKILGNCRHATQLLYAGLVKGAFLFLVSQPTLQPLDKFHKFLNDEDRLEEAARGRLDIKEKFDWDGGSPFY